MNIPKIFWKYYDLYRRKIISIDLYQIYTGIEKELLVAYLDYIQEN